MKIIFNIFAVLVIMSFIFSPLFTVLPESKQVKTARAAVATFELNPLVLIPLEITAAMTTDLAFLENYEVWQQRPDAIRMGTQNQTSQSTKTGAPIEIPSSWEDALGLVLGIGTGVATVGTGSALSFDSIVKQMVRQLVRDVANSLKGWAQGGFKGQPSFVKNWKGMLNTAAMTAANGIFSQIPASLQSIMCTPISLTPPNLTLKIGLRPGSRKAFATRNPTSRTCNFDAVRQRFARAQAGFENGCYKPGVSKNCWDRGGSLIARNMRRPSNNARGLYYMARDEQKLSISKAVEAKKNDAMANKGFQSLLSWTDCVNDPNTGDESCNTQTPGGFVADTISETNLGPFNDMMDMTEISDIVNGLLASALSGLTSSLRNTLSSAIQSQVGSLKF
jgi:hypothetical protein